jgi:hypothetical protein
MIEPHRYIRRIGNHIENVYVKFYVYYPRLWRDKLFLCGEKTFIF